MTEATETETAVEAIAEETVETADVTPEVTEVATPREPVIIDRPIQTVGRRKEAVVRV
ncbi:MAG TPA: 30S ribosomal protein S9, partial [Mycobacterium sp.]|nr:30S ribosomal protein S9 [Mycobacterium sp.]